MDGGFLTSVLRFGFQGVWPNRWQSPSAKSAKIGYEWSDGFVV